MVKGSGEGCITQMKERGQRRPERATYPVQQECRGQGGEGRNGGHTMKASLVRNLPGKDLPKDLDSDLCF